MRMSHPSGHHLTCLQQWENPTSTYFVLIQTDWSERHARSFPLDTGEGQKPGPHKTRIVHCMAIWNNLASWHMRQCTTHRMMSGWAWSINRGTSPHKCCKLENGLFMTQRQACSAHNKPVLGTQTQMSPEGESWELRAQLNKQACNPNLTNPLLCDIRKVLSPLWTLFPQLLIKHHDWF